MLEILREAHLKSNARLLSQTQNELKKNGYGITPETAYPDVACLIYKATLFLPCLSDL